MELLKKLRLLKKRVDNKEIERIDTLDQLTTALTELSEYNRKDVRLLAYKEELERVKLLKEEFVNIGKDVTDQKERNLILFGNL